MSLSRRLWKVFKLFKWESVTSAELMDDSSETNEETLLYLLHFSPMCAFFFFPYIVFVINLPPLENAAKLQIMYKWGFFFFVCVCQSTKGQSVSGHFFVSGSVCSRRVVEKKEQKKTQPLIYEWTWNHFTETMLSVKTVYTARSHI